MSSRVNVNSYWTPWEHEVCNDCYESNPYAIWLIKLRCFQPHHHQESIKVRVVFDHNRMALQRIRRMPKTYRLHWFYGPFEICNNQGTCPKRNKCVYAHCQNEVDMWNIKKSLARVYSELIASLSNTALQSQCPSEVCRACFEANPKAIWLVWLKCTNTDSHQVEDTVVVVVNSSATRRVLIKVRPLPAEITELDQVERCPNSNIGRRGRVCNSDLCQRAHTSEELLYWQWKVARRIFEKNINFKELSNKYEYPEEDSGIINDVFKDTLVAGNYKSKYHKLVYLEEVENSRKMITECDNDCRDVVLQVEKFNSAYQVYLMDLSYTAMDYASHNRADVIFTLPEGQQYSARVSDTPDFDQNALILQIPPQSSFFSLHCQYPHSEFRVSVHFEISHQYYRRLHVAIDSVSDATLEKLIPSQPQLKQHGSSAISRSTIPGFSLDKKYQHKALMQMLVCNPSIPYLLLGPFGTGKTYLLAATVTKLLKEGQNLVLACTHLNRGADGLYKCLQERVKGIENDVARVVGGVEAKNNLRLYKNASVIDLQMNSHRIKDFTVLVTTFGVALNMLNTVSQTSMQFTHILIDEGAQCPEPEALGALVLASPGTRVVIVGDNKQVGPQIRVLNAQARENGLGESLLERLFSHYKSVEHSSLTKTHTSTLLTNYRCHPSILMLASSLFYECTLLSQSQRTAHPKAPYPLVFACTSLKQDNFTNCPPESMQEAKLLITKMIEFIHSWPTPPTEPIGLLASTKQQVAALRKVWRRTKRTCKLHGITVEIIPTYNIQGEEFSAVFLSTVEPTDAHGAPANRVRSICNEYVFNTVITRAQSLIFVAGNPFFLLHMGSHFKTNCWMEYIRRSIQCQSFVLPINAYHDQNLPNIVGRICKKVLLNEDLQHLQDEELDIENVDFILQQYISDLNDRWEYILGAQLVQSPSGDMSWIRKSETSSQTGIVWCQLDCKNYHDVVAEPLDSKFDPIKLKTTSTKGRRGAFHQSLVKVDMKNQCVLFDDETERALSNTQFGTSFLCRVDAKNPTLFIPIDNRYPKFANLPMFLVENHKGAGVVCFDQKTINSSPKVSNFIPLEVAAKMLFIVKFLGWQSKYPYPLGIIVDALPPSHSLCIGELVLRISNNIPLSPCLERNGPKVTYEMDIDSRIEIFNYAFTIDPKGSTDHSNALTCKLLKKTDLGDLYEIGIHIINVQHAIPKDSELDKLACLRGCSVYRSPDQCISCMFPKEMIKNDLSITEDKPKITLSVVAQYHIKKDGRVEEVQGSVKFIESKVCCVLALTYEEAQKALFGEPNYFAQHKIESYNKHRGIIAIEHQLSLLWKISSFNRTIRLGEDGACSFLLDEHDKYTCPEAHYLIEELMIWANKNVAARILRAFPDHTVLSVEDKPPDVKLDKLRHDHGKVMSASLGLKRYLLKHKTPVDQVHILRSTCEQIRDCLKKEKIRNALHYIQFEHLHPQIAVAAIGLHQCRKSYGSKYNVSTSDKSEYLHDTLQCNQHTHFTSPLQCYIDIVVQRLLHAAINQKACPYSTDELGQICQQVMKAMQQSNCYNKEAKSLELASSLVNASKVYVTFIQRISEDAEVELTFADPQLKVLDGREKLIRLKWLNALSFSSNSIQKGEVTAVETHSSSSILKSSTVGTVTWQVKVAYFHGHSRKFFTNPQFAYNDIDFKRYADITLFVPERNNLSECSNLDKHRIHAKILPCTYSMPQEVWAELQKISKLDLLKLRDPQKLLEKLLKAFPSSHQPAVCDLPSVASYNSSLLIYKIHRPIQTSEVLQVQLTASPLHSVLSPSPQLVEVGPELRICIQHNSNPSECFADKLVKDASKRKYNSLDEYFRCWEQVLLAEAVRQSHSESELLIVKDVILQWPQLDIECDSFGQVVYKLIVPSEKKDGGVVMELPSEFLKMSYEFFNFNIGDLLCIRYDVEQDNNKFGFVFHMVIHHAEIENKITEHGSKVDRATFYLKFVGQSSNRISPEIAQLLTKPSYDGIKCEIQLLPLTPSFRRVYGCLHDLRLEKDLSPIAKDISLGAAITSNLNSCPSICSLGFLTQDELSTATSIWLFQRRNRGTRKKLNAFQKKAINIACGNRFTLIQGPPGTGKSVTGAHMAYTFAKKLHKEHYCSVGVIQGNLKPCVMYCGPSNQAVNVVLDLLTQKGIPVQFELKILRVFSKAIEEEKYPGPKLHDQVFPKYTSSSASDSSYEPQHEPFALHECVRKVEPKIAEMDAEFIKLHKQGKIASKSQRQMYNNLISTTENKILRENVDIVLCTCNEASSRRIRTTLKPVYCIIDECAMSTEPECMVPIQRAEHVVLIGDHQQLRPVIKNHVAEVKGLGTSLFERYVMDSEEGQLQQPHVLEVQYRMHPELCKFPSKEFYKGKLKTDGSIRSHRRHVQAAHLHNFWPCGEDKPFVFVNLVGKEGGEHTKQREVNLESKFNTVEARKIADIASTLVNQHQVAEDQIAALTPYSAQKKVIKQCLEDKDLFNIRVKTVTKSQGSEYGIVLLSTVRSKPINEIKHGVEGRGARMKADIGWIMKNIGFVRDSHQICVGITRCKYGLVIVGNKTLLSYVDVWNRLIDHYEDNRCVVDGQKFP